MIRDVSRRMRALEDERKSAVISASFPFIELEDAEWLLALPLNTKGTNWDSRKFSPEQAARFGEILSNALAAVAKFDPSNQATIINSKLLDASDLERRMAALPDEVKPCE